MCRRQEHSENVDRAAIQREIGLRPKVEQHHLLVYIPHQHMFW